MKGVTLLCLASCAAPWVSARNDYGPAALRDEIHNLPGAPSTPWRMFSGYIDVSHPDERNGTRQMFYWFVESQLDASQDPLILWTNGGPGCSGLTGFMAEQGPFRPSSDGQTLNLNEMAWNKVANMVFIEQPVGVGFSTVEGNITYGDDMAAEDNYRFAVGFFARYQNLANLDFFISAESYGGHYMPTLAKALMLGGGVPTFRGVFLGNPLTWMPHTIHGQYETSWGHQLLPKPLWEQYVNAGCKNIFPPTGACNNITDQMDTIMAGLDPYGVDFPVCNNPAAAAGHHERWALRRTILRAKAAAGASHDNEPVPPPFHACSVNYLSAYYNRKDVQSAIHVKVGANFTWSFCSNKVGDEYSVADTNKPMMPNWSWLINNTKLRMMIYSGDDDTICSTLSSQQFIWDLGLAAKPDADWMPWKVNDQVAGFRTDFEVPNAPQGAFSFTTVHSAGHQVPWMQPARSLQLLKNFLGKPGPELAEQSNMFLI